MIGKLLLRRGIIVKQKRNRRLKTPLTLSLAAAALIRAVVVNELA